MSSNNPSLFPLSCHRIVVPTFVLPPSSSIKVRVTSSQHQHQQRLFRHPLSYHKPSGHSPTPPHTADDDIFINCANKDTIKDDDDEASRYGLITIMACSRETQTPSGMLAEMPDSRSPNEHSKAAETFSRPTTRAGFLPGIRAHLSVSIISFLQGG